MEGGGRGRGEAQEGGLGAATGAGAAAAGGRGYSGNTTGLLPGCPRTSDTGADCLRVHTEIVIELPKLCRRDGSVL